MTVFERYCAALDERTREERERAAQAKATGDEREQSIRLMKASMLGDMLKALGRAEHEGRKPHVLEDQIAALTAESEKLKAREDFDSADRAQSKAETIGWALAALRRLEGAGHE